jgi:hypothetical protein
VLCEEKEIFQTRIHAVGQREINDPENTSEGNQRLDPVTSQWIEAAPVSAGKNECRRSRNDS